MLLSVLGGKIHSYSRKIIMSRSNDQHSTGKRIAYMMSRFPKISETFILYEMLALEQIGVKIEVFPLIQHREPKMHAEAASFVARAHYSKPFSLEIVQAHLSWMLRNPFTYWKCWIDVLWGNRASLKFLARSIIVMLQAGLFAKQMQAHGIEHIHAHWATHPTLAAFIIHQLTGIPYSFTAHAHDIFVERSMLEAKIRDAAFVITISQYNLQFRWL
jgi:colanic acid/amylovoran biosynthesis glycosyltransferase